MNAAEFRAVIDALPFGKRLPGAVYLIDPGDDPRIPPLLRITTAELRKRLEIGPEFNLLKFHTASPKISFLAYPDFEKHPHPALQEAVIIDLVTSSCFSKNASSPRITRNEQGWTASAPSSANSDCARKPSATGLRRKNGRRGIASGRKIDN